MTTPLPSAPTGTPQAPGATRPSSSRLWIVAVVVAGMVLLTGAVWLLVQVSGGSDEPAAVVIEASSEPEGLLGLMVLLNHFGAEVERRTLPFDDDSGLDIVFVLPSQFTDDENDALISWQRDTGGTVVTSARSEATADSGALAGQLYDPPSGSVGGFVVVDRGVCDIAVLDDVDELAVASFERLWPVSPLQPQCFGSSLHAVVAVDGADGPTVRLAGISVFTNQLLGEADNAVLAATLLAPQPGTRVALVEGTAEPVPLSGGGARPGQGGGGTGGGSPGGADQSIDDSDASSAAEERTTLADLVPTGAKLAGLQLLVALALYAWSKARRLGSPVSEPLPVELASSGLVSAVGHLLQRTGSAPRAARALQEQARRQLADRLGLPADAPVPVVSEAVAARSKLTTVEVIDLLSAPRVHDDQGLVLLARQLDTLYEETFDGLTA